jgi:hypothetical protein
MTTEQLLKHHGWTLESDSPLEIRHLESSSFATGLAAKLVVDSLPPVEMPLQVYDSSDTAAPPVAGWPLNPALWEPHLGTGEILTFTALVPLETLVRGSIDELNAYCQEAFGDRAELSHTEFRVIPAEPEDTNWGDRFQGDVALQVTGTLSPVD